MEQPQLTNARKRKAAQPQKLSNEQTEKLSFTLQDISVPIEENSVPMEENSKEEITEIRERKRRFLIIDDDSDDDFLPQEMGYFAPTPKKARRNVKVKTLQTVWSLLSKEKAEILLSRIQLLVDNNHVPLALGQKILAEIICSETNPLIKLYLEDKQEVGSAPLKVSVEVLSSLARLVKKGDLGFDVNIKETSPQTFELNIYLMNQIFSVDNSMNKNEKYLEKNLKLVIPWLRPDIEIKINNNSQSKSPFFDPSQIFDSIKPPKSTPSYAQPSGLLPVLRPYQKRAIEWMIQRESEPEINWNVHPLWRGCI